jgi:carotenoid cleavage dioxygenase
MLLKIITLSYFLLSTFSFINFKKSLYIKKDIKYNIDYDTKYNIINKINGFYGLIGPDIDKNKVKTLYELFTGDGIIQGVFFDNGKITYLNHHVKTEKIIYENKNGELSKNILLTPFYILLYKLGIMPNIFGLANTAFMKIKNNVYILFERDYPYEIDIDFNKKEINTVKKINIPKLNSFSGHSKTYNDEIHTIDYNVIKKMVSYYKLTTNFNIINKIDINTKYLPIIHDFYVFNNNILFTDSPLFFNIDLNNINNIPVIFKKKPTYIHLKNINNSLLEIYKSNESFYIFHYAYVNDIKNKNIIEIFAPLCYNLDFSKLDIKTNYSKIIINKDLNTVEIKSNPFLNVYNLDFPILYKDKVILRNIHNNSINGFVICKELDIVKTLFFGNRKMCGEPSIINIDNISYLISFAYNSINQGFIILINLNNYRIIEIPLNYKINIGFHAIFIDKKKY